MVPDKWAAEAALRDRVTEQITRSWHAIGRYSDDAIRAWAIQTARLLEAAERQMASITAASIARELGVRGIPIDYTELVGVALRGIDPVVVMERPGFVTWTQLSKGASLDAAAGAGLKRALSLAATYIQLAKTHTARQQYTRSGLVEWHERVPEGRETCALCLIASTQRYSVADLQPIHPGCDCGVRHHTSADPGQVINQDLLERTHAAVAELTGASDLSGRAPDYRELIAVREHGEIGPVLTWRDQQHTGPSDVAPTRPLPATP